MRRKVMFVIQMKNILFFTPKNKTHPEFGAALLSAQNAGVGVVALDCNLTENSMSIGESVAAMAAGN